MQLIHLTGLAVCLNLSLLCPLAAQPVQCGEGRYTLAPAAGDRAVPRAPYRSDALLATAAPTNQWYSSLIFNSKPEALFVQPITVKPVAQGLEFALPSKEVVATERRDVEVRYPHRDALLLSPSAFEPGQPKLTQADDWSVEMSLANGADQMKVTVAHGSPFAYIRLSRGDLRLQLPASGQRIQPQADARVLALSLGAKTYALFGPTGVRWEQVSATEWLGHMPQGKDYLSVAALPDASPQTLGLFTRHAYTHIVGTRVEWHYDQSSSQVETVFTASTRTVEGSEQAPLLGLYPHHWFGNAAVADQLGPDFDTVRGKIRLLAASRFKTRYTHHGFVPFWPGVSEGPRSADLRDAMKSDARNARRLMLEEGRGPYWQGKGLQRITKLMDVLEQQGDLEGRDRVLALVKGRFEEWLSGASSKTYFHYDKAVGTVVSYPEEFFFVEQLNDQHFTYGYWIRAAADVALRDPVWAEKSKWGCMIDLLIADIAFPQRGSAQFPFLRTFDAYEGHSWASGIGMGSTGNNQEASSEAINAWAGIILWAEIHGDTALRDLGLYLYTTEIQAAHHYWFDIHHQVFAPEYKNLEVSQLFGGMYAHNTWWIDDPRQIKGINLLPLTTASTYLARDPSFVQRNLDSLKPEIDIFTARGKSVNPPDIWQDIFAKYQGLTDPAAGLARWNRWGSFELGDTRSHALHWLLSLAEMGVPDFSVTADSPLYAVFRRPDGGKTYLVYNATQRPLQVRFSDGKTLLAVPGKLSRAG